MTFVALPPPGRRTDPKAGRADRAPPRVPPVARPLARPLEAHRGHWKPTDAGVMHSPQIGLWHC